MKASRWPIYPMVRIALPSLLTVVLAAGAVAGARGLYASQFQPASAAGPAPTAQPRIAGTEPQSLSRPKDVQDPEPVATAAPTAVPTESPSEPPAAIPTTAPARPTQAAATPAPTAQPVRTVPSPCPATWFCYPRLGVAGPIVPYEDCSGSTDVGTAIRSFTCLGDHYLMGHAYTQFGLIRGWAAGDVVFAFGARFTITGAVVEAACSAPVAPLAALSMQTSLSSSACGPVLVVQAR